MLIESKTRRVRALHKLATSLDPTLGQTVVGRCFQGSPNSRRIVVDAGTVLLLHPQCRLTMGWGSAHTIRELNEQREDSLCLELLRHNMARVQANIFSDGNIEIHRFEPGVWERALGLDGEGDSISVLPHIFVDSLNPVYQAWLEHNPRPAH